MNIKNPDAKQLLINGNLRTIPQWQKQVFKKQKTQFPEKELKQLEKLDQHYRSMITKNKEEKTAIKRINQIKDIKKEIGGES